MFKNLTANIVINRSRVMFIPQYEAAENLNQFE